MNCFEAKKISIESYLSGLGIKPKSVRNGSALYLSPFRNESTPSFSVDLSKNIWYDFGLGDGGTILDLVMKLNNTEISGALSALQMPGLVNHSFSFSNQHSKKASTMELKSVKPLRSYVLIKYLNSRSIPAKYAKPYVKEAHYAINGNDYFALAFKNDEGGFELRNKYFKGSSSPKAITTIKGISKAVNVFEGFIDFLCALHYYKIQKPGNTTIVLNSVSNLKTAIDTISKFSKINLYLDNDNAGRDAANSIYSISNDVENFAEKLYPEYKDMNDFLLNKKIK